MRSLGDNLKSTSIYAATTAIGFFLSHAVYAQPVSSFEEGTPLAGDIRFVFNAVSDDGSVVVGASFPPTFISRPFTWTSGGPSTALPLPPGGIAGEALDVSGDGTIIVGKSAAPDTRAVRWTSAGAENLGIAPGFLFSEATAISKDGSTIVGTLAGGSAQRAFMHTDATGIVNLGVAPGFSLSFASDVSNDGSVIVGTVEAGFNRQAFHWTSVRNFVTLGTLGGSESNARGVSGDGNVVVGVSRNGSATPLPFRWDSGAGMVSLGTLPGGAAQGSAEAASYDGDVIVGTSTSSAGVRAFYWTAADGIQDFKALLEAEGVDLTGIELRDNDGVNDDGTIVIGSTTAGTSFLALYGHDAGPGLVTTGEIAGSALEVSRVAFLGALAGTELTRNLTNVALNFELATPNEQPTRGFGGEGVQWGAYVLGQGLRGLDDSNGQSTGGSGSIGLIGKTPGGLKIGFGIDGQNYDISGAANESSASVDGMGLSAFANYTFGNNFAVTGVLSYTDFSADVYRRYQNGAATETAFGTTDGKYIGAELAVSYTYNASDRMMFRPYLGAQYGKASFDAYSESGGTFSGTVSEQSTTIKTAKIGADFHYLVNDRTTLTTGIELERTVEDINASTLSVTSLSGAAFGGGTGTGYHTSGTVSLGAHHKLSARTTLYGEIEATNAFGASNKWDVAEAFVGLTISF
jgi:probable HAF family extracellular repeat protein